MTESNTNSIEIFPWTSNFEAGIKEIDEQHKELVNILNRLAMYSSTLAKIETLEEIFNELVAYTDYHFKTEDKIWDEYFKGDSWYSEHKKTHSGFINQVLQLKANKDNKAYEDMILEIIGFLAKWLVFHILDTDKLMAKTVLAIKSGLSLEDAKTIANEEMSGSARVFIDTVLEMYNTLSSNTMSLIKEKTLRLRIQNELEEKNKELEKLLSIQSKQASMGEMISMITHQWKLPLGVINMTANNIELDIKLDNLNYEELEKYVKNISQQVSYLSQTIDDFRDYFKPNQLLEDVSIMTLINNTVKIIGKSLELKNIKLEIDIKDNFSFKAYENELLQVMLNLLNNAKDVLIENNISNSMIKIKAFKEDNTVNISVEDNGGGIKGDLDKIFDAYYTTKSSTDGTGLGLYMVRNIIEKKICGTVNVQNTSEGALFSIVIPFN